MKKIFVLLSLFWSSIFYSQTFSISSTNQTLTCGTSYTFYDTGGSGTNYSGNENYTITVTAGSGSCVSISFSSFSTNNSSDALSIYDGNTTAASALVGTYFGSTIPAAYTSSTGVLTFVWTSNANQHAAGWQATIQCAACAAPPAGTYLMNNTNVSLNCPSTSLFYDSGGSTGDYANSQNFTKTFTAPAGSCLQVVFGSFATESCCDDLIIYDGSSTGAPQLGSYAGATGPGTVTTTGSSITFNFSSDGSVIGAGWTATITCVVCPTVSAGSPYLMNNTNVTLTCPSTSLFYDSGGSGGSYSNSSNLTKTFTAPAGSCLQVTFNSAFDIESCCDKLQIFDGANGSSPSLGSYSGTTGPGIITSSGSSLTFSFTSDGSVIGAGWEATITCVSACTGTPTGGTAISSTGGCTSSSVTINISGASTGCGLTYQWQSATSASGPWSNISGATNYTLSTATSTNYFRRVTSCGVNSGPSTAVQSSTNATAFCLLSTYTAATTTYSFENFTGTTLPTTDDVLFTTIVNFGFSFCFGGSQYWGGYVASNSAFVFDAVPCFPNIQTSTYAAGGVSTGYSISSPAPVNNTSIPRNAVLGPWHDIHPGLGGTIRYYTTGTAPNRRFVVSYENIPMFSCGTSSPSIYYTGQIKLFETSNAIEIHVGNKGVCPGFNSGRAVMGLHSYDGTSYVPPVNATAHNSPTQWTMSNTAYRFESPCAVNNGPCAVLPISFKSFYGEHFEGLNKLYWSTSEESNIKHFIVERSTDAINFKPVGYVLPKNNPSNYSLSDQDIKSGTIYYYRITAEENDGQRKSTFIYPLGGNDELSIGEIYPNPATSTFNIGIINKEQTEIIITLKDMFGRILSATNHTATVGVSTISLNSPASNGVYIVEVVNTITGKILSTQKLVVTK